MHAAYHLPEANDDCGWKLLQRAYAEYKLATIDEVKLVKRRSVQLLLYYGWKSVFKENLNESQTGFKNESEAKRFDCTF